MPKAKAPATRMIRRGNGHSYELDGVKAPGVTTALGNGLPKPALVGWAARMVAEYVIDRLRVDDDGRVLADDVVRDLKAYNTTRRYPERLGNGDLPRLGLAKVLATVHYADRDEAGNRGTEVHKLAEALADGREVDVPPELAGHVDSYLRFLEEWDPTDAILEAVVASRRWHYMGRLDMIATLPWVDLPDGTRWGGRTLLDVKTSRSGPFGEVALQLAGYGFAEVIVDAEGNERAMERVDSFGVVWVRADGYDVHPFIVDELAFRTFLKAKDVGAWLDRDNGPGGRARLDAVRPPA
jgi:hypothetical protein